MAAHSQGIALYQQGKFNFYQLSDKLVPPILLDVENAQNNTLWASTEKYGLLFFRNNNLFHLSAKDGLLDNHSTKLTTDKNGALLCLTGKGIQKISIHEKILGRSTLFEEVTIPLPKMRHTMTILKLRKGR